MGDSTGRDFIQQFEFDVVKPYKDHYLRPLNASKAEDLSQQGNGLGLSGMCC